MLFLGIDWGSKVHAVCVADGTGKVLLRTEVAHRGTDVLSFVKELEQLSRGEPVIAAMEAPHGVMVEVLLERGIECYSINPKQLDRFRDRHSCSGAKDDPLDAYVLARSLCTDLNLFRKISIPTAEALALSALNRSYEGLTEQVLALSNQICDQLVRYFPQLVELGDWHQEPWLWKLFEAAPTPARAPKLSRQKLEKILKDHRIRRHEAASVLQSLREKPLPVAAGVADAAATRIRLLLPVLRVAHQQRRECSQQMKELLARLTKEPESPEETHHDAALLLSLPGIGVHNGAVMLVEASQALQQRDYQALRRLAGVAPVSKRTGGRHKRPLVTRRHACNHRLREATYHWGRVASQTDPRTREHYAQLRASGHSHGRAIRGVLDRLLKVLCAMLRAGAKYAPNEHPAQKNLPLPA